MYPVFLILCSSWIWYSSWLLKHCQFRFLDYWSLSLPLWQGLLQGVDVLDLLFDWDDEGSRERSKRGRWKSLSEAALCGHVFIIVLHEILFSKLIMCKIWLLAYNFVLIAENRIKTLYYILLSRLIIITWHFLLTFL
jgi:hypothetical protein